MSKHIETLEIAPPTAPVHHGLAHLQKGISCDGGAKILILRSARRHQLKRKPDTLLYLVGENLVETIWIETKVEA